MHSIRFRLAIIAVSLLILLGCGGGGSTPHGVVPPPPTSLTYTTSSAIYTKGLAIAPNIPSSSGGAVDAYSLSPILPAGLILNPSSGVISGTPTALAAAANYTVTASNGGGSTTVTLAITVNDPAPSTPVVTTPNFVTTGATKLLASTQDQGADKGYTWVLTGGTITSGQGTPAITFTAGSVGTLRASVTVSNTGGNISGGSNVTVVPVPDGTLIAPASVHPGDGGMNASVPNQSGMTYLWTIIPGTSSGTITSGQGTSAIGFSAGSLLGTFQVQVNVQNQAGFSVSSNAAVAVATKIWTPTGSLGVSRYWHTATLLQNGKVLVAGGDWTGAPSTEVYDPAAGTWAPTGNMNVARKTHTATLLQNGKVLVAGGWSDEVSGDIRN